MAKPAICKRCSKGCRVGYNGITTDHGTNLCDSCAGVQRDRNGYAWMADENQHVYIDNVTGEISTMTRKEAFSK